MQMIRTCACRGAVVVLMGACGLAAPARAGTWPEYTIQRIGLYGPEQTGSGGLQFSIEQRFNARGFVAGTTTRYTGVSTGNGRDVWAWNGTTTTQIGLTGAGYTGSAGYQDSILEFQNDAGQVVGYSHRITGVNTSNGQVAWAWNGTTTTPIGFTGAGYTGSAGFQYSDPHFQNAAGQVAGYSNRINGVSTFNGRDAWVWNGTTTTQIGLTGGANTGSAGYQVSFPEFQNAAGQVAGYSDRISDVNSGNGRDVWAWNGTTTMQMGLTGGSNAGSAGYQFSSLVSQNDTGQVVGISERYTGVDTNNGRDAWAWNGTTTTPIGFTGAGYTGSAGYQNSAPRFQNAVGHVTGYSQRITGVNTGNGQDAWAWNGTTTTQIGLTGGAYTGSGGYQYSVPRFQNTTGQVAGYSPRVTGVNTNNGQDAWAWNGTTTAQIGLTGGAYTGSAGFQYSEPQFQNAAGQVAGFSQRITGASTNNGQDAWAWNGTTTTQIGLTGGANTGNGGYRYSEAQFQNAAGQVAGLSQRITGLNMNGQDAWAWNGTTTTQIGLTGGVYTGSAGRQFSSLLFQNAAGHIAGVSRRYTGVNTQIGQDAWYFDPTTLLSMPIIGSVRTSDNYAFSEPAILTEDGFLLGFYSFFAGGVNPPVDRSFIFHPELGFTDLGDLVTGGLALNGWSRLRQPQFADALSTIVGFGYVSGQTTGRSVFVMTIPAPGAAGLLGLCGVIVTRRRRMSA